MGSWRDIKRAMRRDVHRTMLVPALYLLTPTSAPLLVNIRPHVTFAKGEIEGENGLAAMLDQRPRVRFDRKEIDMPETGAVLLLTVEEGYRVGESDPADDEFVFAQVTAMTQEKTRTFDFAALKAAATPAVNPTYADILTGVI